MNAYAISIISQLIAMALLAGVLIVNMYLASYSNAKKRIAVLCIALVFEVISWAFLIIHSLS